MGISKQIQSVLSNSAPTGDVSVQLERCREFSDKMRSMGLLKQGQDVVADPHSMGIDRLRKIYATSCSVQCMVKLPSES
jgi:hypothetical protein